MFLNVTSISTYSAYQAASICLMPLTSKFSTRYIRETTYAEANKDMQSNIFTLSLCYDVLSTIRYHASEPVPTM